MKCLERSQAVITEIRKSIAIVKVDTHLMSEKALKVATMYRVLCLAFLKEGSLLMISKRQVEELVDTIESCVDKLDRAVRSSVQKSDALLNKVENMVLDCTELLQQNNERSHVNFDITWDLYDPNFQKFQARVCRQLQKIRIILFRLRC